MKRILLSTAILAALAGGGYAYNAVAQPDTGPAMGPGPGGPGPAGPGPMAGAPAGPGLRPGGPCFAPHRLQDFRHFRDKFGLFAHVGNKNLTTADVKIIASAILLEHGNHSWTVTAVAARPDKSIGFSFASPHGDVIATFSVDPASGRIKRVS